MMVLTSRELLLLMFLITCVPFQLWLVQLSSQDREHKSLRFQELLLEYKVRIQAWLSPHSWYLWLKEIYHYIFAKDYNRWFPDDDNPIGECPAVEVLRSRNPDGYFATSVVPRRKRSSTVKWRVGQVIKHKRHGYTGVVIGWDQTCQAPYSWIMQHYGNEESIKQPNYAVLVDIRYRSAAQTAYVLQDNIEIVKEHVDHPAVFKYFDFFDGAQYIPQPWLKALYPLD